MGLTLFAVLSGCHVLSQLASRGHRAHWRTPHASPCVLCAPAFPSCHTSASAAALVPWPPLTGSGGGCLWLSLGVSEPPVVYPNKKRTFSSGKGAVPVTGLDLIVAADEGGSVDRVCVREGHWHTILLLSRAGNVEALSPFRGSKSGLVVKPVIVLPVFGGGGSVPRLGVAFEYTVTAVPASSGQLGKGAEHGRLAVLEAVVLGSGVCHKRAVTVVVAPNAARRAAVVRRPGRAGGDCRQLAWRGCLSGLRRRQQLRRLHGQRYRSLHCPGARGAC